jgi:hypothetical protein
MMGPTSPTKQGKETEQSRDNRPADGVTVHAIRASRKREEQGQDPSERVESRPALWAALRELEAGRSLGEVVGSSGLAGPTLETAWREAMQRQHLIRQHIQSHPVLTSLLRYPNRGPWGKASYAGNCPGYLIVDLIDYFKPTSVFDPMEGAGTTGEVCFDLKVDYLGRDLRAGFDLLSSPLPDRQFDLIFWHPPYWPGYRYSDHPNDLSNAKTWTDYLERLHEGFLRLCELLPQQGTLAILIGDGRKNGIFYPIHNEIIQWGLLSLEAILVKEGDHHRRAQHFRYGPTRFIPTLHEYVLIFKRREA